MIRPLYWFSAIFVFASGLCFTIYAEDIQPDTDDTMDRNRRRALVLDIDTRVLEERQVIVWNETHRKVAIPGSPVGIKMVGANIVVAVQFTPFIRRHGNTLVAQGQIWFDDPDKGITYYNSIQTIPMEFGEPIYFFPLGQSRHLDSFIEIMLIVNLYSESIVNTAGTAANTVNDR